MTTIRWISGTGYDFFISLLALHSAGRYGLRPNWTAGVRQRLPTHQREFLEQVFSFASVPLEWISSLTGSKDALPILSHAEQLSPADLLSTLILPANSPVESRETLIHIASRKAVNAKDRGLLGRTILHRDEKLKATELENLINTWIDLEKSNELILASLQEYYRVFFADEETRIRPAIKAGLEEAQKLSKNLKPSSLVEKLSRGVRFEDVDSMREIVLVPSYWSTPFVFPSTPAEGRMQIVFGCRPDFQSIAPGAESPDNLVNALKCLADPTRLRILRYLTGEPLTPTELSHRLRLRPPTVLHHLHALRLAELVAIRVSETGEKRYTARAETLDAIYSSIKKFIVKQD